MIIGNWNLHCKKCGYRLNINDICPFCEENKKQIKQKEIIDKWIRFFLIMIGIGFIILFLLNLICKAEEEANWDGLINAIIIVESGGDSNAIGDNGNSIGLMQLSLSGAYSEYNLIYGPYYTPKDLYNPEINMKIGRWYLKRLKNHYLKEHYTVENLLASWNWGIGNVHRVNYNSNYYPKSVKQYTQKVLSKIAIWKEK